MRKNLLTALGIAALCVGPTFAQALTEYTAAAAAAAGSFTGSAAGKKVSDLLDRAASGGESPEPQPKVTRERINLPDGTVGYQTVVTPAQMPAAPMPTPSSAPAAASGRRGSRAAAPVEPTIPAAYALQPATSYSYSVVEPPAARTELLASLAIGSTRDELQSTIGVPASRVTIPGQGLTEIYYYAKSDSIVGTVRVIDGLVAQVNLY